MTKSQIDKLARVLGMYRDKIDAALKATEGGLPAGPCCRSRILAGMGEVAWSWRAFGLWKVGAKSP